MLRVPKKVITFGYLKKDFEIVKNHFPEINVALQKEPGRIYLVYIGRGGYDMQPAIKKVLVAFKELLESGEKICERLRFRFIGTSYAPNGTGTPTFLPVALSLKLEDYVEEHTDRVSFFESIKELESSDGLIIPGSDEPGYTASKIYPYVLAKRPLLALFNPKSSAYHIINDCKAGKTISLSDPDANNLIKHFLLEFLNAPTRLPETDWKKFDQYSAKSMTEEQCNLFNIVTEQFEVSAER